MHTVTKNVELINGCSWYGRNLHWLSFTLAQNLVT